MYFIWNTDIRIQVIFLCTIVGHENETTGSAKKMYTHFNKRKLYVV